MQGKVHVLIGAGSLALFCVRYPQGFEFANTHIIPVVGLATAAFGSYLPDIDQQRTHMGQKHKVVSNVVNKVGGGHRGFTHTLVIPILLAIAMFIVGTQIHTRLLASILMSLLFGAEFGYVMHIVADLFNGKGCPLLWPIMQGKVHIMDLPSSGIVPYVFAVIFLALFGVILFRTALFG